MQEKTYTTLEFYKVKERIMDFALSEQARERIHTLVPSTDEVKIKNWLKETTEARAIIQKSASAPLSSLSGMERVMGALKKGYLLQPDQLTQIWNLLDSGMKLIRFMKDKETLAPLVSTYAHSISGLSDLAEEIQRCIYQGQVADTASKALAKARKKVMALEAKIKDKLDRIIRSSSNQAYFQSALVSVRDGRYVIPVKKEYKKNIDGNVLDHSSSGATVYVEPTEVKKLQNELNMAKVEEEVEVQKILSHLTNMVEAHEREISINIETMVHYDFIFAKAKYSKSIDGQSVDINKKQYICLKGARHPLLASAHPLDFSIGDGYRALVITGPNTGGKTVAIKTVGLITMMAQAGLHVPVEEGSVCAIFEDVLVDIGDGQSIEQSLSTFSAHMTNVIQILKHASPKTLVILDELGAGTDPAEGKGLAIAILEKLAAQGATLLATTHYSEIKEFADEHPEFENGSMEFDVETLQPLYRLNIGKAGESQAFSIAYKLGMDREILQRANELTYKDQRASLTNQTLGLTPKEVVTRKEKLEQEQEQVHEPLERQTLEHDQKPASEQCQSSHGQDQNVNDKQIQPLEHGQEQKLSSERNQSAEREQDQNSNDEQIQLLKNSQDQNQSTEHDQDQMISPELDQHGELGRAQKLDLEQKRQGKPYQEHGLTPDSKQDQAQSGKMKAIEVPLAVGDRVYVSSLKTYGIVCEPENHRGEVGVLIQHKKVTVNKKRLTLQGSAKDLYPENYDLDIVLQTKENRKKSKMMQRKHVDNLIIEHSENGKGNRR